MRRRLYLLLTCFMISMGLAIAQSNYVRGSVVDEKGVPVIGASVIVKGTTVGAATDADGEFEVRIPEGRSMLIVSYLGMVSQEVKAVSGVRVVLKNNEQALNEVVVTAMGVKRSSRSLGSSSTTLSSSDIEKAHTPDPISALSGKVAGVDVSASSTDPGASTSIVIRGYSSLNGSNQPLFVIDGTPVNNSAAYSSDGLNSAYDFGNGINAVNPNDIESMTILKGAAATSLYGSRAANGVVLITTKSGSKQSGMGIEYSGGLQFSNVLRIPQMQNEFGMGWNGVQTHIENGSWGAKADGTMQLWGSVYDNSQKLKPYTDLKNNVKDFFDTGLEYHNSLSYSGATDRMTYFASMSQLSNNGILPTSADKFDRYTFSGKASYKNKNFKLTQNINYSTQRNSFVATGQGLTMVNGLYQMPRDISIIGLKDLSDPFNTPNYYYTPYGITNPYYILKNEKHIYNYNKLFGNIEASYDFLNNFNILYRLGLDNNSGTINEGTPDYKTIIQADNSDPAIYSAYYQKDGTVNKEMNNRREVNQDLILSYKKNISDLGLNAMIGFNANDRKYSSLEVEVTGLDIPLWYNLSNSSSTPVVTDYSWRRRLYGAFSQVELSWKDMLYLTLNARNDWSSTLPKNNNSFFYSGAAGSFVFSELLNPDWKKIISFGKLRLAWGQTGNDADPYQIYKVYTQSLINLGFGSVNFPLSNSSGSYNAFTLSNQLGNSKLQPEITTETEIGTNVSFLQNRISVDATYYYKVSDKQIMPLSMDPGSGFSTQIINLGKISNKGVELLVNVRPIEVKDFSWDISWNYTHNKSNVVELAPSLGGKAYLNGLNGGVGMYAIVGHPIGTFMATVPERDSQGHIIVDANGLPVANPTQQIVGDINPKYEMGFGTVLRYKSVSLSANLDIRKGGLMYSNSKSLTYFTGNAIQTAYNDRNPFVVPNSIYRYQNSDGTYSYAENTTALTPTQIGNYWADGGSDLGSGFLIDRSYVKLRNASLSWVLPQKWFASVLIQDITVSAFGNNLFLWTPKSNTFIDPETSTFGNDLNGKYGEFSANPTCRTYGFSLSVKF